MNVSKTYQSYLLLEKYEIEMASNYDFLNEEDRENVQVLEKAIKKTKTDQEVLMLKKIINQVYEDAIRLLRANK
jgi:adenylate kinase family enzyme